MASILDLVKHYQQSIEKYPNDEQKVLKCIDKLYNLGVTVQHLQETGVGRTVNALRKEPGDVGQAARALVYKWKVMVAAEESDQEGEHNDETSSYNGHEPGRDYDSNPSESSNRHNESEKYVKTKKIEEKHHKQTNGDHSGSKRKYHSSEEEGPDTKKSKYSSSKDNGYIIKPDVKVKVEPSDSKQDSQDDTSSESDSDGSHSTEEERKPDVKVKIEKLEKAEKHGSSKQSSRDVHDTYKYESSSESVKEQHKHNASESRQSSEKSSGDKSNSSQSYKSSKEGERSIKKVKEHRSDKEKSYKEESSDKHKSSKDPEKHNSSNSSEKHKSNDSTEKHKSGSSSEKHKHRSSSEKHRSDSSSVEKHRSGSSSEKHKSSSSEKHRSHSDKGSNSSEKHSSGKSDKEKYKSSSDKEILSDKHKSKETISSSKDKHSSSSKEKSKDKRSSSKEKESSHKSDKKHSSSKEVELKSSDSKRKIDSNHDETSGKKSKHKSSSSSSKSSSSKSKEEIPKKQTKTYGKQSDDGIDCGSGASFAEALGMISPAKPKKKSLTRDSTQSPNSGNEDLSPATLLAPTAKLAPLPALEISALPEISPNYRPRPPTKVVPHFTDEDAMNCVISSKNQRTKVYSGNKVMGKIPTLYEMCVHVLQEHIDALEYTGGVPYEILKPVVDRATPQQLFLLEHYNPYLMEDTDHLWQKFCEKSFRTKKRQEFETWREMYMRCQEEQEVRLKSLTNNIRIAQEAKKAPIKQTKMAYVDSVVKPPRNILKKQAQHGTAFAATASPAARVAALAAAPNVLKGGRAAPAPVLTPSASSLKPKKAPLMQKALQFMRGRKR